MKELINIHILVLFDFHTESKILTFVNTSVRPDMLPRKILNEKFIQQKYILLKWKKICLIKIFLTEYKFILTEWKYILISWGKKGAIMKIYIYWIQISFGWMKTFDTMKKIDIMKICFIKYKIILIEWKYIFISYKFLFLQHLSNHSH